MDILLALIFGAVAGGTLHYLMPGRVSRGAALAPLVGALVGGASWSAFTWAGVTTTSPWIWIVSIVLPLVVVPILLTVLTRTRASHDARERVRLKIS
ncbi:GlsB/YeaQ/YmgE family stress response membrane protein [Microbacterium dextranolyticum]|uniref:GlsB/YeaQ/YmgE family stress response membrane protein n=1 Tax=Microbacterium dextranolyticum TaxID=36806 RepID=A0A9W6HMU3_9MICO|nr:hypothetical protein [Microbacterium dextranolyticum]MBM7463274.1 putative membrane protein YeaQ/YmgE (transglycosylase-associated protein family) [Microbacterium dextranolyticum]GLJ95621.1 hypothetical protein GCM10017591_16840 [Microbacterium dextranolyticum]